MISLRLLFVWIIPSVMVAGSSKFCWKPKSNPFYGQPKAERIGSDKVRIDWTDVFNRNENCNRVDFLIKSNPRHSPSNYKLSDFTLKGHTSATLLVTDGEDFVFQVIAREDKGPEYGIDYKYSQMVTSYYRERDAPDIGFQEVPTTEKLRVTKIKKASKTMKPQIGVSTTTSLGVKVASVNELKEGCDRFIQRLIPINTRGQEVMKMFLEHTGRRIQQVIEEFLESRRACSGSKRKGYLYTCSDSNSTECCLSPWGNSCSSDYEKCDGRCINKEWIDDGWPDCMDGRDEPQLVSGNGESFIKSLQCIQCTGHILAAEFLCRSKSKNIESVKICAKEILYQGDCGICVVDYFEG